MKVAIVGSEGKFWTPKQRTKVILLIQKILADHIDQSGCGLYLGEFGYPILISGGCGAEDEDSTFHLDPGVDGWAEIIADSMYFDKDIKYSKGKGWKYYKKRNIEIAQDCDILFCIEPKWLPWMGDDHMYCAEEDGEAKICRRSGGIWTYRKALELGKEAYVKVIE